MKFIHLGDLHLGKKLNDFDLIEDQKYMLNKVVDLAIKEQVDAVMIAGDVYDKAIPPESAVNLFNDFLIKLVENKIETFVITGNHDSDDRLNFGSSFFDLSGIHIGAVYNGKIPKYKVNDEHGEVNIYLLPFVKASTVRNYYPKEQIESYEDAIRVAISNADIDKSARNVILSHQFVTGDGGVLMDGSESLAVRQTALSVGTIEKVSASLYDEFDYVALGHIHRPQKILKESVRYSGSLLKYSLSEVNSEKSIPLVTLGKDKGDIKVELAKISPLRNLRHVKGELKTLLSPENVVDNEDYMYISLTDEEIINDAIGIVRQTYPNTIKLDYDNSHTKEIQSVDISKITESRSFAELISDFYSEIYGRDISEEELEIMKDVAKEAGVSL